MLAIERVNQVAVGDWSASVAIAWQQPVGLFGNNFLGFNFTKSEFLNHYQEYEQYAITGMRLEFNAVQYSAASADNNPNILVGIWTFDDPNSYDPIGLDFQKACQVKDLRAKPINRKWHEYKDCRAYSASQNVAWQNTKDYSALTENGLTKAATYTIIRGWNEAGQLDSRVPLGYMTISWYIVFRG